MIMMWLGSLVLLIAGMAISLKALQAVLAPLRERSLDGLNAKEFPAMLRGATLYALGTGSEVESSIVGVSAYNLRLASRRGALLLLCLSLLGLWWPLALVWGYLQYNGLLILGVAAILWVLPWNSARNKKRRLTMIQFFFGVGLFYFGAELMVKNASLLLNLLGTTPLAFWLVEKSWLPLLSLTLAGFILSFVVKVSFFSVALSLILMMSGSITFVGALFLFVGERLGYLALVLSFKKRLQATLQKSLRNWALSSTAGLLVGAFIVISAALSNNWGGIYGVEPQVRNQQFVVAVSIILFFQFVAQMAWGHFASAKAVDEGTDVMYLKLSEVEDHLTPLSFQWLSLGIETRLAVIKEHIKELAKGDLKSIPESVQDRLASEEKSLEDSLASATSLSKS